MTSLLVSAAQQETLMASPSSCSEKVLPLPPLPFPCSRAGSDLISGPGSAASRCSVLAQNPVAAASSPGRPVASLLLCWGGDARNTSSLIFFPPRTPSGEVTGKRTQLCGTGLLHGAHHWIQLGCKDQDGQVMICLGETTSPA